MRYSTKTLSRGVVAALCTATLISASGCGASEETPDPQRQAQQGVAARKARRVTQRRRLREARRVEARQLREAARRQARRAAARQRTRQAAQAHQAALAREEGESEEAAESSACDPSYSGACLDPYASDYDCEGGSGDGPSYTGGVVVVGDDHYELDADNDGYGCE
jgi:serine phosphatase RsbU (regulator of sigma subunit)